MFDNDNCVVDGKAMYKALMGGVVLVGWLCVRSDKSIVEVLWKMIIDISSRASML